MIASAALAHVGLKRCCVCKQTKSLDDFNRDNSRKDGRLCRCKACQAAYAKKYRDAHPDQMREEKRRYWAKHHARLLEQWAKRRDARRELTRAEARLYYARHRKIIARRAAEWYKRNRLRALAYTRSYRASHITHISERNGRWKRANRDRVCAMSSMRRARKLSATIGNPEDIKAFYRYVKTAADLRCHWCGNAVEIADRHVDHIVPLARGGLHCLSNLCCACSQCNLHKGALLPSEFIARCRNQE